MIGGIGKPLRATAVTKVYVTHSGRRLEALRPVSVDIAAGEFVAVVGPTGCGKSTLLHLIAGFLRPTTGQISIDGAVVDGPGMDRSMVFQSYALFPWLSVAGNVEFGLRRRGLSRDQRRAVALEFLRLVGLQDAADRHIAELSGGMKQRVALARALAVGPSILLMDEPFAALDALTRRLLQQELVRIWQAHRKTVVFITHSVEEAVFLADRILVMTARPGRIKAELGVAFSRPRDRTSEAVRGLERQIHGLLEEELGESFKLEKDSLREGFGR